MQTVQHLWADMGSSLWRFIRSKINDAHVADDITQDVMLKVQLRLGELPPEDKLPAWMFAMARNAVIDHYRARAVREHADVDEIEPVEDAREVEPQSALRDLTPCVSRMIELLPEPYREAMKLADVEGLSQQELADRIGISLSGAKSRVQRARQHLRDMIERCCKIERDGRGNVLDYEPTEQAVRYCQQPDGEAQCGR